MRNTEERVSAVKLLTKKIEYKKQMRKKRRISIASIAASLILLVGLSFAMPDLLSSMSDGGYNNFGTAASIFDGSSFFGFVLIGFLAFALGVSVTILSYKIRLKNQLNQEDKEGKDD